MTLPRGIDVGVIAQAAYDVASYGRGLDGGPYWEPVPGVVDDAMVRAGKQARVLDLGQDSPRVACSEVISLTLRFLACPVCLQCL